MQLGKVVIRFQTCYKVSVVKRVLLEQQLVKVGTVFFYKSRVTVVGIVLLRQFKVLPECGHSLYSCLTVGNKVGQISEILYKVLVARCDIYNVLIILFADMLFVKKLYLTDSFFVVALNACQNPCHVLQLFNTCKSLYLHGLLVEVLIHLL